MKIGCVLMAAGNAARFGKNKLLAEIDGRSIYMRAMDAIPCEELYKVVVVSQYDEILREADRRGFAAVVNPRPEDGISFTIKLGIGELADADALMFMVADQPKLTRVSVLREIEFFRAHSSHIVAMGNGQRRGNPAIFPKEFQNSLLALSGDRGGSDVIRANEDRLLLCQIERASELFDVDNEKELEELKALQ